jgi:hypothetical protein
VPDLLRQNRGLAADNVWNWTLPAWVAKLPDGRNINVCPSAGACAKLCYARNGTYRFPAVVDAHNRNLLAAHDDGPTWRSAMLRELERDRFRPTGRPRLPDYPRGHLEEYVSDMLDAGVAAVRIHDSGDFFSSGYLDDWVGIASRTPDVLFYAYTKAVTMVRAARPGFPPTSSPRSPSGAARTTSSTSSRTGTSRCSPTTPPSRPPGTSRRPRTTSCASSPSTRGSGSR